MHSPWRQATHVVRNTGAAARVAWRQGREILLPPRCVLCDDDLDERPEITAHATFEYRLCRTCYAQLLPAAPPYCHLCGMPRQVGTAGVCRHCVGRRYRFTRVFRLGQYEGVLREAILRAKTIVGEPLAAALGELLGASIIDESNNEGPVARDLDFDLRDIDLVATVPSYWTRRLRRGTNSAAVMAQVLAHRCEIPAALDLLVCRRNIEKQSHLPIAERRKNVRGAFHTSWGYDISSATVLLVDDVMTTGATANEVAGVLRRAGAENVLVAVGGRALGPDW